MNTREVTISADGRVHHPRIDANVAFLVKVGAVRESESGALRRAFHEDYDGTLARFTGPTADAGYLDFARATGVLTMIDDPRVGRSWERRR
jgi:hypothetical protein